MKMLFLHIGDMHFADKSGLNSFCIQKIADAVNSFDCIDKIIIFIVGDIAQAGTAAQYNHASHFLGNLIASIKRGNKSFANQYIDVACVPGNHDLNHNGNPMTSDYLQGIRKVNSYEKHIDAEIKKQNHFFNFAKRNGCFKDNSVFSRKILDFNGYKVEINMINSGVFSILEEDKGLHYLPLNTIDKISTPTGSDFVITLMHHAPDWYIDSQKNALEEAIYGKSSIVFYGHEHYLGRKSISVGNKPAAFVQAGGCLCENDKWSTSAFHVGVYDTDSQEYNHGEFRWNVHEHQYEHEELVCERLPLKPSIEMTLSIPPTYYQNILLDEKHSISDDFRKYYVFPRIQCEERISGNNKEFDSEDSFLNEILSRKKILITGAYNSGKTALLKMLFLRLSTEGYTALYCDIENVHGKNADRMIKNCFQDIYGSNESDYLRFEQIPKDKKVLIVDDVDQIQSKCFDTFLNKVCEKFDYIIFASKQLVDLSLLDRMKSQLTAQDSIYRYRILPMYTDKRQILINKIVSIKIEDPASIEKTTRILAEAISAQRRFISMDPDFIIKFVEYYCNNIGDAISGESGVFSKVFEASLVNAVSKYQTNSLSVDKIFVLLSKVAYYIHFNKAYPITDEQISTIISCYNDDYGDRVSCSDFMDAVKKAKILVKADSDDEYRFASKSYLAYYTAREVNSRYNDTRDETDLQSILKCACFGINADILLFISYITDNIQILRLILNMAEAYTKEWDEFDFSTNTPEFLRDIKKHEVELPPLDAKEKEQQAQVRVEKESEDEIQTVNIYDYSEEEIDNFVNQLIRAMSLLSIVSRCLPNFEHSMRKPDKDAFVSTIYSLPNKIYHKWVVEANKEVPELIKYFREQSQDYYARQKKMSEDDIIRVLQWTAMSFLLDLYNLPVVQATRDNTMPYLSEFNYGERETYSLEHLIMMERQAPANSFISEALGMVKNKNNNLFRTLITRVVGHALVFKPDLSFNQRQQLQSKFFPDNETQVKLLLQRSQNQKKENE